MVSSSQRIKGIDSGKCTGCGLCIEVCPNDCFEMVEKDKKIIANVKDIINCDRCGKCVLNCESMALIVGPKSKADKIETAKCDACEACVLVCPKKNIEIRIEGNNPSAEIIDNNKCCDDGYCFFVCSKDAIICKKRR